MSVAAISMVKDEEDIIGATLPRMARQVDFVLIADNMSTDCTRPIIEDCAREMKNIIVLDDDNPAYVQSAKMTYLSILARERGADWVIPFDADEVWVWNHPAPLVEFLPGLEWSCAIALAELYDHVVTGIDDPSVEDFVTRTPYRRDTASPLPKVACRTRPGLVIEMGNHNAHYPGTVGQFPGAFTIHHFPYRSVDQMVRKASNGAAAYKAAGNLVPAEAGRHWREYGSLLEHNGPDAIAEIFETWFYSSDASGLTYDPVP